MLTIALAGGLFGGAVILARGSGSEFMPQLNEGDLIFMPIAEQGFQPAEISVKRGGPVRLTFVRTTDNTCVKEIVVQSLEIRRPLPLNEPVVVEFTPREAATVEFTCGMAMLRGTIVVQ